MKVTLGCLGGLLVVVIATVLNGWALMVLWGWFVVPVFAAPLLNFGQALGLAVIVAFLTHQDQPTKQDREFTEIVVQGLAFAILKPIVALGFGWIYLQFA